MYLKTLEENIVEVQGDLYRIPGISTQLYSQDIISAKLHDAFILFATDSEKVWKRFITSQVYTLDETTGRATTPVLNTFKDYDHILFVYPDSSDYPLTNVPFNQNPSAVTGNYARHVMADSLDVLKVIPITSVGTITVIGRIFPTMPFNLDDTIPFDYLALKYFVAWQMIMDDGSNPGQAEIKRQMYEARYNLLYQNQSREPISLSGRGSRDVPRDWFV